MARLARRRTTDRAPDRPRALVVARGVLKGLRPKQWVKNAFVFAGVVFARELDDPAAVGVTVAAFVIFCLLSGATYLINDVLDHERDRLHPKKRHRPIAAGIVSRRLAVVVAAVLAAGGIAASFAINLPFALVAVGYAVLTFTYSTIWKHIVLVDVLALSLGYVARAAGGAIAIDVVVSQWLLLCTILLALFIGLTKRRHELLTLQGEAAAHRKILEGYSAPLLDQMISLVSSAILISYALYTFFSDRQRPTEMLIFTFPFVIYGLFRYLYLTYKRGEGGSPEELVFSDAPLIVCLALWATTALLVLYL